MTNELISYLTKRLQQELPWKIVQTPQCFSSKIILKAYEQEYNTTFTDDASVVKKMGETIFLVDGNRENIKITTTADLIIAGSFF